MARFCGGILVCVLLCQGKVYDLYDVNKIVQTLKYTNDLGRVDVLWIIRHWIMERGGRR